MQTDAGNAVSAALTSKNNAAQHKGNVDASVTAIQVLVSNAETAGNQAAEAAATSAETCQSQAESYLTNVPTALSVV